MRTLCRQFNQFIGSNRTFMELKFPYCLSVDIRQVCSNRTFMELKYMGDMLFLTDSQF